MATSNKLCYKANNLQLAYKSTGPNRYSLIYKSASRPDDATISIDFYPKLWTCLAYGQDHEVRLTIAPSWWDHTSTINSMTSFSLSYTTMKGTSIFSIGLNALTHCDAEVYPTITAIVVVQQGNVGTFTKEIPLTVGVQSSATITTSAGRITSLY